MYFISLCKLLGFATFFINLKFCETVSRFDLQGSTNLVDSDSSKDEKYKRYQWNKYDPRTFAFLRMCGDYGSYEVQPLSYCSKGIVFKEPFIPNCICPFGVWILKTSLCSETTFILVGDSRRTLCYSIEFPIRSILYLGDPENIHEPRAYVASQSMTVFHEIPPNGEYTPKLKLDKPVVIAIFPKGAIETDEGTCFPLKEYNTFEAPVHIWSSDLEPARYRIVDKCTDEFNFGYDELAGPYIVYLRSNKLPNYTLPHARCQNHLKCAQGSSTTMRPFNPIHSSSYPPGGLPTTPTTTKRYRNKKTKAELELELLTNPIEVLVPGEESKVEYEYEVLEIEENEAVKQGILNVDGSVNIAIINESISENPNDTWSYFVKFVLPETTPEPTESGHNHSRAVANAVDDRFRALEKHVHTHNKDEDNNSTEEEKELHYRPAQIFAENGNQSHIKPGIKELYPNSAQQTSDILMGNIDEEGISYPTESDVLSRNTSTTTKIPEQTTLMLREEYTTPSKDKEDSSEVNTAIVIKESEQKKMTTGIPRDYYDDDDDDSPIKEDTNVICNEDSTSAQCPTPEIKVIPIVSSPENGKEHNASATAYVNLQNAFQLIIDSYNTINKTNNTSIKEPAVKDVNVFPLARNTMVKYKSVSNNKNANKSEDLCDKSKISSTPPKCPVEKESKRVYEKNANYVELSIAVNDYQTLKHSYLYKYLDKVAHIFTRVCPTQHVSNANLRKLLNVFQAFMERSENEYVCSEFEDNIPEQIHNTNLKVLDECLADSVPFSFQFDTECPFKVACGTFRKHDKSNEREIQLDASIPSSITFNMTSLDISIETAWKLSIFLRYFCGKNFVDNVKMEDFILLTSLLDNVFTSAPVLNKWYHPLKLQKSPLANLFGIENLDYFFTLFDSCLGFSKYFLTKHEVDEEIPAMWKQWTARPMQLTRRKRNTKTTIPIVWGNLAYCINSYWDPLKLFPMSKSEASCYIDPAK